MPALLTSVCNHEEGVVETATSMQTSGRTAVVQPRLSIAAGNTREHSTRELVRFMLFRGKRRIEITLCHVQGSEQDTMLCLQHKSVYTIGKRGGFNDFRQDVDKVRCLPAVNCHCGVCTHLCSSHSSCWHSCRSSRAELKSMQSPEAGKSPIMAQVNVSSILS